MSYYVLQPLLAAVLVALAVLGAVLALRSFTAGEVRRGLRRTGWALVPLGALAVGVSGLVARVVGAMTRWAFQLVFSPVSWVGVVLLVLGGLLIVATRGGGERRGSRGRRSVETTGNPYEAAPGGSAPRAVAPGPAAPRGSTKASGRTSRSSSGTDPGSTGLLAELEEMGLLDEDERR